MDWIKDYQLFLFDFDGLLVNTEEIHYMAYKQMCRNRGFDLQYTFPEYCTIAHYENERIRKSIYASLPGLLEQEPAWEILYAEKSQAVKNFYLQGAVQLMPGVKELLEHLQKFHVKHCVVTHSALELVSVIREQIPLVNAIPHWITRFDYNKAKPDPECYHKAISQLAATSDSIIGFEDSPRGVMALLETPAKAIMISPTPYPEIPKFKEQGALHYLSMAELLQKGQLG